MLNELKAALSAFNRRYPSVSIRVAAQVDRRVAISREKRFIYFRVPKAANSTVTATLYRRLTGEQHDPTGTSRQIRRYFARAHTLTSRELENLRERFFLFAFVRDPFARVLSAYLEKVRLAPPEFRGKRLVYRHYRRPLDQEVSFLEFCTFIDEGGLYADAHWYPQMTFLPVGVKTLHFLGRVETLDRDLREVFNAIFGEELIDVASKVRHATGAADKMRAVYCDKAIEIVQRNYRADFEQLGYGMSPKWKQSRMAKAGSQIEG